MDFKQTLIDFKQTFLSIGILICVFLVYWFFFSGLELNTDDKNLVPISNYSGAFSVYVDGTKCIVVESENHGAISCNWNYKPSYKK